VGPGNYAWNVGRYEPPQGFWGNSKAGRASHSMYVDLLAELGLAGVVIMLLMLRSHWKDRRTIGRLARGRAITESAGAAAAGPTGPEWPTRVQYLNLGTGGGLVGFLVSGAFVSVLW